MLPLFSSQYENNMIEKGFIQEIVEQSVSGTSMFLVDVAIRPGNIIVVEIDGDEGVSIDDCIALSRKIESQLDRDTEDFELEVGSAGITSPFKILRQYQKNIGKEVEILTRSGQKLKGMLKSCSEDGFILTITKKEKPEGAKRKIDVYEDLPFKYDEVKYTKYIISFK